MSYEEAYQKKKKSSLIKKGAFKTLIRYIFVGAGAFLVSSVSILDTITPFPFAVMALLCFHSRSMGNLAVLAVLGAYAANGLPFALQCLLCLILFAGIRSIYKKQVPTAAIAALAAIVPALINSGVLWLLRSPPSDYINTAVTGATAFALTPILALGYSGVLSLGSPDEKSVFESISIGLIAVLTGIGLASLLPALWHVYAGAAAFVCLYAACYLSGIEASAAACLLGVGAIVSMGGSFGDVGIYAVCALIAYCLRQYKHFVVASAYLAVYSACLYISGSLGLYREMISAGVGCTLFLAASFIISRVQKRPKAIMGRAALASQAANRILRTEIEIQKSMIREMARNMTELGKKDRKSAPREVAKMLAADICSHCSNYESCWHSESDDAYKAVSSIVASYLRDYSITYEDASAQLIGFCEYSPLMFKTICSLADSFKAKQQSESKNSRFMRLMREQFSHLSRELDKIYSQISRGLYVDPEESAYGLSLLKSSGIDAESMIIMEDFSKRRKAFVTATEPFTTEVARGSIPQTLSSMMRTQISYEYEMSRGNEVDYIYAEDYSYKIITGVRSGIKEAYDASGDAISDVVLSNGQHLIALSDGMGSGDGAHSISNRVLSMYEELINAGFDEETSTQIINTILVLNEDEEIFVTLDMFLFDLDKGVGEFMKAGAAPSFIKRADAIEKIEMESLPLGILEQTHIQKQRKPFKKGDFLYFMSDGFFDSFSNDDSLIREHIIKYDYRNPQKIADCLYDDALGFTGGEAIDDITIVIARIR
ncbi:MAG: SpoIIE family protein phosphatase [Eubacteriaceae bacterium]|nr:SpoIIE family protein phosphatase [Eubacteriaceae bacterium]